MGRTRARRYTSCSYPSYLCSLSYATEEEEEDSDEEDEDEDEEVAEVAPTDGLQTPSGMETPSGMASVVSTVAGGLETPDFLEVRKNASKGFDVGGSSSRSF